MIQLATSSVWMFCSVMMSPDDSRTAPQARRRLSGSSERVLGLRLERVLGVIRGLAEREAPDRAVVHATQGFDEQLVGPGLEVHEEAQLCAGAFAALSSTAVQPGTSTATGLAR